LHPAGAHLWLTDALLAALFVDVLSGYVRITALLTARWMAYTSVIGSEEAFHAAG
jgi:hypothetical protein